MRQSFCVSCWYYNPYNDDTMMYMHHAQRHWAIKLFSFAHTHKTTQLCSSLYHWGRNIRSSSSFYTIWIKDERHILGSWNWISYIIEKNVKKVASSENIQWNFDLFLCGSFKRNHMTSKTIVSQLPLSKFAKLSKQFSCLFNSS